uniref:Uncharacterized protein n=1 Tax=Arundo donax TaxID=35708 RepID=A0A0A8ZVL2_ARUDO
MLVIQFLLAIHRLCLDFNLSQLY